MLDEGIKCKARAQILGACLRHELAFLREREGRPIDAVQVFFREQARLTLSVLDTSATAEGDWVEVRQIDNFFLLVERKEKMPEGRAVWSAEYRARNTMVIAYANGGLNSILHQSMTEGLVHAVWKIVGGRAVTMPLHGNRTFKEVAQVARLGQLKRQ